MNGRITRSETYDAVCKGCAVWWRVCLLERSPQTGELVCPECFEAEADADTEAANDNGPHCTCRNVCPVCTPGA